MWHTALQKQIIQLVLAQSSAIWAVWPAGTYSADYDNLI